MPVRRIVPDIHSDDPGASRAFYEGVLGLELAMDLGWVVTFASPENRSAQITLAKDDASATVQAVVSIEVDDVDAAHGAAERLGCEIVHPLTDEPWGVRRFFVRDPNGAVLNILSHTCGTTPVQPSVLPGPGDAYVSWLRSKVGGSLIVLPSVTAVVRDADGQVLLQLHAESGQWGLPGGAVEPEERPRDALVREVLEETGLEIAIDGLIGVYGGPDSTVRYRNGDVTSYVRAAYAASPTGGALTLDGRESAELRWTSADERRNLRLPPIVERILGDAG